MTPDEYAKKLHHIASETIGPALKTLFAESAMYAEDKAKQNLTGRVLRVRSGNLRASMAGFVRPESGAIDVGVKAGGRVMTGDAEVKYAAVHEYGEPAVMTPKRSKYLRIPLAAAKTQAGVDRFPTSLRESAAGLFYVRRAKNGKLYLFHKDTNKPWYLLVRSAKVKRRPFIRPAMDIMIAKFPKQASKAIMNAIIDGMK